MSVSNPRQFASPEDIAVLRALSEDLLIPAPEQRVFEVQLMSDIGVLVLNSVDSTEVPEEEKGDYNFLASIKDNRNAGILELYFKPNGEFIPFQEQPSEDSIALLQSRVILNATISFWCADDLMKPDEQGALGWLAHGVEAIEQQRPDEAFTSGTDALASLHKFTVYNRDGTNHIREFTYDLSDGRSVEIGSEFFTANEEKRGSLAPVIVTGVTVTDNKTGISYAFYSQPSGHNYTEQINSDEANETNLRSLVDEDIDNDCDAETVGYITQALCDIATEQLLLFD